MRSFFGIAANASSVGAKTVRLSAELSVSTRSASVTAATSVLRSGLFEAAVATGSSAMPSTEPSPEVGTPAQPGPNGASAAIGSSDSIGDSDSMGVSELDSDVVGSDALPLSLSLPQAARPMDAVRARAARPIERVRSLVFMTLPFGWSGGLGGPGGPLSRGVRGRLGADG